MKSKRKFLPRLKAFFSAILIMACAGGMTSFCLANVPIKLEITGTESFTDFCRPSGGYTAELTGVQPTGEYEWSISSSTYAGFVNTPQGKYATIEFTSFPAGNERELTVKLSCKAYYMVENERKYETDDIYVKWVCPNVTFGINGNTEVLEGLEETYTGSVSIEGNYNPTVQYTWRVGDSEGDGVEADSFTTTFDKGGQTVTLYCDIKAGDIPLKAEKEIHVHSYAMTVERWDYSGPLEGPIGKRKVKHNHSTSLDAEIVYIHYNIDDDDEDGRCDFKQEKFIRSEEDDDLCKLKIDINVEGEITADDLDKQITITISEGLRLWRSQMRKGADLLLQGKKNEKVEKTWTVSDITGDPIYIEGLKHNSLETLTITFGKITKTLQYKTCSVGTEHDQPNLKQRKKIKGWFKDLVDCEWYVLRPENQTYNCIAFSVDPYLTTFEKVDYKGSPQIRNNMKIDPNYPYPFWVNDVFFSRISPPENQNDKTDRFWLRLAFPGGNKTFLILREYLYAFHGFSADDFKIRLNDDKISVLGHKPLFKTTIVPAITLLLSHVDSAQYYLTMNDFNPSGKVGKFDWNNDVNAFFTSAVWKKGEKNLKKCSNSNDEDRVIRFYTGFHAARRASTLEGKERVEETDMPEGWYIFASKCGKYEAIIHREEQICGAKPAYGQKDKSYKY